MKKRTNPLTRRIPRELAGDWRKYLVVFLFLVLTICFVSGMYVANESMMRASVDGVTTYKLEYGHFELSRAADDTLLAAIETGGKADVRQFYTDKARRELGEKFPGEFRSQFDSEFRTKFDAEFQNQVKQTLLAGGLDADTAAAMLDTAVAQAKADGTYQSAYSSAYQSAYTSAYNEAYNEAWAKIADEIDEKYADAEEKYDLNDPDFQAVPVTLYENFYRNEDEDHDNDGTSDGTIRVYTQTNDVNLACLIDGAFPVRDDEIAHRPHARRQRRSRTGDTITVGGKTYRISGLIAYVNYATLHEKATDLMFDALKFDVAMVAPGGFARLQKPVHYVYAWQYADVPADETAEKALSDDFLRALLTQTVVAENDLEDYTRATPTPPSTSRPTTWARTRRWAACCSTSSS